tara:strand:- start:707 stop:922 length:216 start_codon:yes stop_codon:yes gene_type:complete
MQYKITAAMDSLDSNPIVVTFDDWYEAEEWIDTEVSRRLEWSVQHSLCTISDKEYEDMRENEMSLITMEIV